MIKNFLDRYMKAYASMKLGRLMLIGTIFFLVLSVMLRVGKEPKKKGSYSPFASKEDKPIEKYAFQDKASMKQRILRQRNGHVENDDSSVRIIKRPGSGNFFKLSQKENKPIEITELQKENEVSQAQSKNKHKSAAANQSLAAKSKLSPSELERQKWRNQTFGSTNQGKKQKYFLAKVTERQRILPGSPVEMELLEPIRELNLMPGTTLLGLTGMTFGQGRIKIHFTATSASREDISLDCFDKNHVEGLYNDALAKELAKQIEQRAEQNAISSVMDMDFGNKTKNLAKQAIEIASMATHVKEIYLEPNTQVLVVISPEEKKK